MPIFDYVANDGHTVTIERNEDGSFTVSDDVGRSRTYGRDVAENIYQDWDLRGQDLSDSGMPEDVDAPLNDSRNDTDTAAEVDDDPGNDAGDDTNSDGDAGDTNVDDGGRDEGE